MSDTYQTDGDLERPRTDFRENSALPFHWLPIHSCRAPVHIQVIQVHIVMRWVELHHCSQHLSKASFASPSSQHPRLHLLHHLSSRVPASAASTIFFCSQHNPDNQPSILLGAAPLVTTWFTFAALGSPTCCSQGKKENQAKGKKKLQEKTAGKKTGDMR